jgi:diguanylate cyclase (GGDEF)-like protein
MPETGPQASLAQSTALLNALMETEFQMKNDLRLRVNASVGVATAPADGTTVHTVIGAADIRMYEVKNNGRGQVRGA